MYLQQIEYNEYYIDKLIWSLKDLFLDQDVNLFVGKNATGKSRSLATIVNLVYLIKEGKDIVEKSSDWHVTFIDKISNDTYKYTFEIFDNEILKENLVKNGQQKLIVRNSSECKVLDAHSNEIGTHNPPSNKLVINTLRDTVKYPYIEKIQAWAEAVHSYTFSGIQEAEVIYSRKNLPFEHLGSIVSSLRQLIKEESFKKNLLQDLKEVGYDLEDINIEKRKFSPNFEASLMSLKEKDIGFYLIHPNISAGMYRVIHIIGLIESLLQDDKPGTLIIDDIGEGLDFERSTKLTKLLVNKIKGSKLQLIISTNDRFLMNAVDINYWNILKREGIEVKAHNYNNKKELFDEFSLIGLNNFNFFTDFIEDLD